MANNNRKTVWSLDAVAALAQDGRWNQEGYDFWDRPTGIFVGGTNPGAKSYAQRIVYANDLVVATNSFLAAEIGYSAGSGNNADYWAIGSDGGLAQTRVVRTTYSTDVSTIRQPLPLGQTFSGTPATTGNATDMWVFNAYASSIQRIEYANDMSNATRRGDMSGATNNANAAVGNSTDAWALVTTNCCRLTYAADMTNAVAKGPITQLGSTPGRFGNLEFGWFMAGLGNATAINQRLQFSNDNATMLLRNARFAAAQTAGVCNATDGWLGGGTYSGSSTGSNVRRFTFAADNDTISTRGNLAFDIRNHGGIR